MNDDFSSGVVAGTLHVVATPIGNLGDLSPRARAVLAAVDVVAAEDTRHSGALLAHFGIQARLVALHEHNEVQQSQALLGQLQAGSSVAVISDAGTPAISDPGSRLVALAHAAGVPVVAIAGPSALAAAVSVAGFDALPVSFHGFLPPKAKARREALAALREAPGTLVFYEAPHRIEEMVRDVAATVPGDRQVVLARELTKRFESVHRCAVMDAPGWLDGHPDRVRGEFVVILQGAPAAGARDALGEGQRVYAVLRESLSVSEAARAAAKVTGANRSALYAWALAQSQDDAAG